MWVGGDDRSGCACWPAAPALRPDRRASSKLPPRPPPPAPTRPPAAIAPSPPARRLFLNADDGATLALDGKVVIDNGGAPHIERELGLSIWLQSGLHPGACVG